MNKILTKIGLVGALASVLFIPLSVTHAQYYDYGYNYNYNYNNSPYESYYGNNYNYNDGYNGYYNNYYPENYYENYPYDYFNYGSNDNYNYYNPYYQNSGYAVEHLCGPNSTYDPTENDCDCYPGYVSQNNICVAQPVTYSYNYDYYDQYPTYLNGYIQPVAVCNDGTVSYSPVGTCMLNDGVRNWVN